MGLLWWLRWSRFHLQCRRVEFNPWVRKIPWRRRWLPTPVFLPGEFHGQRRLEDCSPWACKGSNTTEQLSLHFLSLPVGSDGKEYACNAGDPGAIPGLGRSPGEGDGYPLQYSCMENSMDRETWQATIHGVARVGHNLVTKPPPRNIKSCKSGIEFLGSITSVQFSHSVMSSSL